MTSHEVMSSLKELNNEKRTFLKYTCIHFIVYKYRMQKDGQ
jgi:hypothetical protein